MIYKESKNEKTNPFLLILIQRKTDFRERNIY